MIEQLCEHQGYSAYAKFNWRNNRKSGLSVGHNMILFALREMSCRLGKALTGWSSILLELSGNVSSCMKKIPRRVGLSVQIWHLSLLQYFRKEPKFTVEVFSR